MILYSKRKEFIMREQPQYSIRRERTYLVQNPSAYWLPSITTKQTIGGTEYTVMELKDVKKMGYGL